MKSFNQLSIFSISILFSGLFFIAGCNWLPFGKADTSEKSYSCAPCDTLLSINGSPVLSVQDYEEKLDMARKANPQIDMILSMMPNAEKDLIFRGMTTAELMKAWAKKNGIDQDPEFVKQRKQVHEAMDLQLYMKAFDQAHPVQVSDSDIAKFYEDKKDSIPGLALSAGGTEICFVRVEKKSEADALYAKLRDAKKSEAFKSVAEASKQQVGTATINEKSPYAEVIKEEVLQIKKFPTVKMIKVGDSAYWIVLATGSVKAQYRDLKTPEVHAGLKKMIEDERKDKQLESLMEKLKQELNVVEHTKYFEDKEMEKRARMDNDLQNSVESEDEEA